VVVAAAAAKDYQVQVADLVEAAAALVVVVVLVQELPVKVIMAVQVIVVQVLTV
jgi:hypothetical protein